MSGPLAVMPLLNKLENNVKVILASQGIRLWASECRLEASGDILRLSCSDATTMENLRHQPRVAFTILDNSGTLQGSGMAQVYHATGTGHIIILVEPYRVTAHEMTYELRPMGWVKIDDYGLPDLSKYAFWYQAFRLVTIQLSALPVLVGGVASFALGQFNLLLLLLSLIGAVFAHAGANATADYFDFKNGVDSSRALSSHLGALTRERVEPEMILLAAFGCFVVTALVGIVLLQMVSWKLLFFGLIGLLGAFFYTGRPFSYKYRALGELMLGVLVGPVIVMGAFYVQTQRWDWAIFLISMALGMLISSISLVNNLRDEPDDKAAGIRTLPMLLGVKKTKRLYYILTWGPYLMVAAAVMVNQTFWPMALVLVSLPRANRIVNSLRCTKDDFDDIRQKSLINPYPLNSIKLHALFGALIVVGLLTAGAIRITLS